MAERPLHDSSDVKRSGQEVELFCELAGHIEDCERLRSPQCCAVRTGARESLRDIQDLVPEFIGSAMKPCRDETPDECRASIPEVLVDLRERSKHLGIDPAIDAGHVDVDDPGCHPRGPLATV